MEQTWTFFRGIPPRPPAAADPGLLVCTLPSPRAVKRRWPRVAERGLLQRARTARARNLTQIPKPTENFLSRVKVKLI